MKAEQTFPSLTNIIDFTADYLKRQPAEVQTIVRRNPDGPTASAFRKEASRAFWAAKRTSQLTSHS